MDRGLLSRVSLESIIESTRWMVLHRPFEPARVTGNLPYQESTCPLAASSGSHLTEMPALSLDVGVHKGRQPFNSHAHNEERDAK